MNDALAIRHPHTGKIVAAAWEAAPGEWHGRVAGTSETTRVVGNQRAWLASLIAPLTADIEAVDSVEMKAEIDVPAYVIDASAVVQLDAHTGPGAGDCVASAEWYPFDAAPGGTWHGLFTAGGAWTAPDIAGALAKIRARYPDAEVVATAEFILK